MTLGTQEDQGREHFRQSSRMHWWKADYSPLGKETQWGGWGTRGFTSLWASVFTWDMTDQPRCPSWDQELEESVGHSHLLTPGMLGWPGEAARARSCHHTTQGNCSSLSVFGTRGLRLRKLQGVAGWQVGAPCDAQRPWSNMAPPWPWWPSAGSNLRTSGLLSRGSNAGWKNTLLFNLWSHC